MSCNNVKIDKFRFQYNKVVFEVIVLIEREPFELLFGVIGHNYSFILELYKGYELQNMPNDVFYRLCDILQLKPCKEELTSFKFLKYVASKIPLHYSGVKVQPHEVAVHIRKDVPESDKIYFCGWRFYPSGQRNAQNFEKTKKCLGDEVCDFCKEHNISSCWTDNIGKRKDYYSPQMHLINYTEK